jgi:hypothetical protein
MGCVMINYDDWGFARFHFFSQTVKLLDCVGVE